MKLSPSIQISSRRAAIAGFTLAEMMVVVVIFSFVMLAMISVQIFGMKISSAESAKLMTATDARETMNALRDQIRAAKLVYVGSYTAGTGFTMISSGSAQQGNALEIAYASSNNTYTNYLIYYLDTTQPTNTLYSISNNVASTLTMQARYMTNYYCFIAEDFQGNVLANYYNNPVIHVLMQFNEFEYAVGSVASNGMYRSYQLSTRVARRAKD